MSQIYDDCVNFLNYLQTVLFKKSVKRELNRHNTKTDKNIDI